MTKTEPQTEPRTPYENLNSSQETPLKLVDVSGNSLTTTSIQLQPRNASATDMVEDGLKRLTPSSCTQSQSQKMNIVQQRSDFEY